MTDDITGEDITGKPGAGTEEFEIDGRRYSIDLSADSKQKLKLALEPFTAAGRRVVTPGVRRALHSTVRGPARIDPEQNREQRRWWKENYKAAGLPEPKDKGRIPGEVVEAYKQHDGQKVHKQVPPAFAAA